MAFEDGDLDILAQYPVDFMSFSYYMSSIARHNPEKAAKQLLATFL